ncbi:MAG: efflux RND transporter periplasmic adaptor subunit [Alphaproteobacteria bacterium]|nr:efflux RND transporter periplasmic adaptor subunit [Alphaproteobacteria bacterium]
MAVGAAALVLALVGTGAYWLLSGAPAERHAAENPAVPGLKPGEFALTDQQRKGLTIEPIQTASFQPTRKAEGKIAVNEDRSTPVFSQYSSARVVKTFANSGDVVAAGAPLAEVETPDMVQGGNDLTTAAAAVAKARAQVRLTEAAETRQRELFEVKAVALKDLQQAQADLAGARNDLRSAEISLAAVRNRLAILGKSPKEIAGLEGRQAIDPTTLITAPIGGVVVQRKVGPGQFITSAATDPVFVLGDLSTVWLLASVKETDVPYVKVGQSVSVRVLAYPDRAFDARIVSVGATIDPATRRLQVRAEVQNPDGMLKPEMFAEFRIATGAAVDSPAVPSSAVIFEGDTARVWVQTANNRFASRSIEVGVQDRRSVQVLGGLAAGDKVVTRGSLFIDRASRPD